MPDIEKLVAINTIHISPATLKQIEDYAVAYPNEYGAFVYVGAIRSNCPADLRQVLMWAAHHDCVWIKFDRDAQEIAGLPTYNWESWDAA